MKPAFRLAWRLIPRHGSLNNNGREEFQGFPEAWERYAEMALATDVAWCELEDLENGDRFSFMKGNKK